MGERFQQVRAGEVLGREREMHKSCVPMCEIREKCVALDEEQRPGFDIKQGIGGITWILNL